MKKIHMLAALAGFCASIPAAYGQFVVNSMADSNTGVGTSGTLRYADSGE
jgi:hypothetical protein